MTVEVLFLLNIICFSVVKLVIWSGEKCQGKTIKKDGILKDQTSKNTKQ